jgi:hypothetical protein
MLLKDLPTRRRHHPQSHVELNYELVLSLTLSHSHSLTAHSAQRYTSLAFSCRLIELIIGGIRRQTILGEICEMYLMTGTATILGIFSAEKNGGKGRF